MYEIIDDNGVIHSGTEEEMTTAFNDIVSDEVFSKYAIDSWDGDLKLIHVINVYK